MEKRVVWLLCFAYLITFLSINSYAETEHLFVSLGGNCLPSGILRHFEMRKAGYPFDWILSVDDDRLIEMIDRDFEDFTNVKYLVKHPIEGCKLVHSYYHLEFSHDWSERYWEDETIFESEIRKVQEKFERKIARFRQLADYPGKVFFFRILLPAHYYLSLYPVMYWFDYTLEHNEKEIAIKLNNTLKKKFPNLNFELIIINKSDHEHQQEKIGNITLFSFSDVDSHQTWKKILDGCRD